MFWSMLPDTVEYGQWRSSIRDDGIVFGLSQLLISKAGSGLGVGMIGLLLSAIGYTAGIDQSAETLQGIRASAFLIPATARPAVRVSDCLLSSGLASHTRILRGLARRAPRVKKAENRHYLGRQTVIRQDHRCLNRDNDQRMSANAMCGRI